MCVLVLVLSGVCSDGGGEWAVDGDGVSGGGGGVELGGDGVTSGGVEWGGGVDEWYRVQEIVGSNPSWSQTHDN